MTSIIKVDTVKDIASTDIIKKSGTSITVGTASDTTTVAGNAVRSNAIQAADGANIISQSGTTITLGATGDTVEIATGASLVGGGISWQSSIVTASTLTAESGKGYWIDTTSNICTITFPGSASAGDQIILTDYARNWETNKIIINQNGLKFQGFTSPNPSYSTNGQSVDLVYSGATKGWIPNSDDDVRNKTPQAYTIEYLVVAGGGGAATSKAGGGGAGGMVENFGGSALTIQGATIYTCTVGGGGLGSGGPNPNPGGDGGASSISGSDITDVTTVGGGGGGQDNGTPNRFGRDGGSGGGGGFPAPTGGSGTAGQGNDGGDGYPDGTAGGGGGGGKGAGGSNAGSNNGGNGGVGQSNSITGAAVFYAGGGGGTTETGGSQGTGGNGGGGDAIKSGTGGSGAANTGGGGGAANGGQSGGGGTGIVVLRMNDANYSGTTTGSPLVTANVGGTGKTVIKFTGTGSYTA
mgnify:CR=1 FL=1|tara:strand:+ start:25 stop:1422 length:1398 start_codon:yes stop_codon:yes gene_type:complete